MSMKADNCPETSSRTSNSDAIRLKTHVNQKRRGEPSFLSLLYGSFHPSMAVSQLESRATCKLVIDHIFHLYKIKSSVGFASLRFNFIQMKYMINNLYVSQESCAGCDLSHKWRIVNSVPFTSSENRKDLFHLLLSNRTGTFCF